MIDKMRNLVMALAAFVLCFGCNNVAQAQSVPVPGRNACADSLESLWEARASNDFQLELANQLTLSKNPACFGYIQEVAAVPAPQPAHQALLTAIENFSTQQQQAATTSSTASTNAVSKIAGPTAIVQEFGGLNVSTGTSALTFQFSPATLLSNLTAQNLIPLCSTVLRVDSHCINNVFARYARRFTLTATANTSSTSQSVTGASSSSTSSTAVPVALTANGTTKPSFGGIAVKAVVLYKHANSGVSPVNLPLAAQTIVDTNALEIELSDQGCPAYQRWLDKISKAMAAATTRSDFGSIFDSISPELVPVLFGPNGCLRNATLRSYSKYLADLLAANATNDLQSSLKPLLGLEYDFNTPQNAPTYSSIKSNLSIEFGHNKVKSPKPPEKGDNGKMKAVSTAPTVIQGWANSAVSQAPTIPSIGSNTATSVSASTKELASMDTPPFTFNASVGADLYTDEPSASIPSASHLRDIQAGAELDWLIKLPSNNIGKLIGNMTAAASYYYQDQTSPSILKGPPSTIVFTGLPSTASQVYTKRGPINLAQIRLGFGSGSNVQFPISATYSNRSELIVHPTWGVQFGLSYNLSSLFSSAAAKSN